MFAAGDLFKRKIYKGIILRDLVFHRTTRNLQFEVHKAPLKAGEL
jgi:hypothetical protein